MRPLSQNHRLFFNWLFSALMCWVVPALAADWTLVVDVSTKSVTTTNAIAVREQVPTAIMNLGGAEPSDLVLRLSDATNGVLALATNFVAVAQTNIARAMWGGATNVVTNIATFASGTLDLNTTELVAAFTNLPASRMISATLGVWDIGRGRLLVNDRTEIMNNPWQPGMAGPLPIPVNELVDSLARSWSVAASNLAASAHALAGSINVAASNANYAATAGGGWPTLWPWASITNKPAMQPVWMATAGSNTAVDVLTDANGFPTNVTVHSTATGGGINLDTNALVYLDSTFAAQGAMLYDVAASAGAPQGNLPVRVPLATALCLGVDEYGSPISKGWNDIDARFQGLENNSFSPTGEYQNLVLSYVTNLTWHTQMVIEVSAGTADPPTNANGVALSGLWYGVDGLLSNDTWRLRFDAENAATYIIEDAADSTDYWYSDNNEIVSTYTINSGEVWSGNPEVVALTNLGAYATITSIQTNTAADIAQRANNPSVPLAAVLAAGNNAGSGAVSNLYSITFPGGNTLLENTWLRLRSPEEIRAGIGFYNSAGTFIGGLFSGSVYNGSLFYVPVAFPNFWISDLNNNLARLQCSRLQIKVGAWGDDSDDGTGAGIQTPSISVSGTNATWQTITVTTPDGPTNIMFLGIAPY